MAQRTVALCDGKYIGIVCRKGLMILHYARNVVAS